MPDTPEQVAANNALLASSLANLKYVGLGAGMGGIGYRLLRGGLDSFGPPKPPPARTMVVDVPVPSDRTKRALFERVGPADPKSWLAGHFANTQYAVPWYVPAAMAAGVGGAVGGYKLTDALINAKRKADLKDDVDEAKQQFTTAITGNYKHAAELDALAARRVGEKPAAALGDPPAAMVPTGGAPCPPDAAPLTTAAPPPTPLAVPGPAVPAAPKVAARLKRAEDDSYTHLGQTADQVGGVGTGLGVTALLGLIGAGGMLGYSRARKTDPARIEAERARRQQAERWATSPPEVLAVPA